MHTTYGGVLEYIVAALLALQIAFAWSWLRRARAVWPRLGWLAASSALAMMWTAALWSVWLVLSGAIYTSHAIPPTLATAVAAIGYGWILLSSVAIALVLATRFVIARIPGMHLATRRRWLGAAAIAAVGVPAAAAAFGAIVERDRYGIRELDLPVPNLHPDLEGFRIVQVSDLHVSPFLSVRDAGRVIDMANGLRPDLTVFTGDLISEMGDPLNPAIRELIRLRADYGVLGCMGNHEQYVGCRNYLERQAKRAGLVFLRDAATQIHRGNAVLNIAGVDYQRNSDRANYLPGVERHIVPGAANLLLSHNPDVFPTAIRRGFQAVLSGHTHGGQVNVEILHHNINPARFGTPFTSGLYRLTAHGAAGPLKTAASPSKTAAGPAETAASCFVTNGIGTIGMPIRLGAPPEIALLRLRRA